LHDPEHASPVLLVNPTKAGLVNEKKPLLQKNLCQSDNAKEGTKDLLNGEDDSDNQQNDNSQNDNGETEMDVLEVWFPGCHTGASLANLAMDNFLKNKTQRLAVTKSQTQPNIHLARFLSAG